MRIRRRNGVDLVRNVLAHRPGPGGRCGVIPDSLITGVIATAGPDHRCRGIDRIGHFGSVDRFELRRAVVGDVERCAGRGLNGRGLRHRLLEQRFPRFLGAGDRGAKIADVGFSRDFGKLCRKLVVGNPGPRSVVEVLCTVPTAGEQNVVVLARDFVDDIGIGIRHHHDFACRKWLELRLAIDEDQLRRFGRNHHFGHAVVVALLLGRRCALLLLLFFELLIDLLDILRQTPRLGPGAVDRPGLEPHRVRRQVVGALVFEDHIRGVDHPLEGRILDLFQHRLAIDEDQDRRFVLDDDLRWGVVELCRFVQRDLRIVE